MDYNQIKKIGGILFLIGSCFLFAGCSEENTVHQEKGVVSSEDKNKEAIQAVLESEFTVPNEEYLLIVKDIDKKRAEIDSNKPETNGVEDSGITDEFRAYNDFVIKTYGPYFMEYAYDTLISSGFAFQYHYGYMGYDENVRYEIKVSDIHVAKSENKNTPKHYDFTTQVEYTNNAGEVSQHEIKGIAIIDKEVKIWKLETQDDAGLREKVSMDRQYY